MKKLPFIFLLIVLFAVSALANAPKSRIANFGTTKVHFQEIGKGKKALILVHGWTCNADFWKESINAFPEYRVIAVDLPGHGKSDKPKTDYTLEYFSKSIIAVMKEAKIEKTVLAGHSMGTAVIRQFYRLYPEKTLGLIVVDGALRAYAKKEEMEKFLAPLRANYKTVAPQFVDGMLQPMKDGKLKTEIRAAMLATPDYVAISAMDGMADEKIWTNDKINVPVLAILGESPFWTPDTKDFYQSIAPDLNFQMWKGVSHFLMMDKPKEFNKEVKEFISRKKLL